MVGLAILIMIAVVAIYGATQPLSWISMTQDLFHELRTLQQRVRVQLDDARGRIPEERCLRLLRLCVHLRDRSPHELPAVLQRSMVQDSISRGKRVPRGSRADP